MAAPFPSSLRSCAQSALMLGVGMVTGFHMGSSTQPIVCPVCLHAAPCPAPPPSPAAAAATVAGDLASQSARQESDYQKRKRNLEKLVPLLRAGTLPDQESWNRFLKKDTRDFCVPRYWHENLPFPWFVYTPIWNCNYRERIGETFDGGKSQCNLDFLKNEAGCVVYSFGSKGQVEYEKEPLARTECDIHIFDPTTPVPRDLPRGITFHSVGLSGSTGSAQHLGQTFSVKSLPDIMAELGHTHPHLHVLKIDIEGFEYDVMKALKTSGYLESKIDELLLEIHGKGLELTVELLETIAHAGMRAFSNEPNLFYWTLPATGIEYSFIHDRVAEKYNSYAGVAFGSSGAPAVL